MKRNMFKTEIKVDGEFVKGIIKTNEGTYVAMIRDDILPLSMSGDDVRTFSFELLNVADKIDELNANKQK